MDQDQDAPTWEPLRERLAARLPDCHVTLNEPRLLCVVVPYAQPGVATFHLGEPWAEDRITPEIVEERVSHVACVGFEATYDHAKWPPERLQSLMGGPFESYARNWARHFAEVLSSRVAPIRGRANAFCVRVQEEIDRGIHFPGALDNALRHRDCEYARADEILALARTYRALAETPTVNDRSNP